MSTLISKWYFKHRKRSAFNKPNPCLKQTNNGNGQFALNKWTAVRVTVGYGWAMGMTESGGYEIPTYPSWLRFKDIHNP